jgi:hypothetical protein
VELVAWIGGGTSGYIHLAQRDEDAEEWPEAMPVWKPKQLMERGNETGERGEG